MLFDTFDQWLSRNQDVLDLKKEEVAQEIDCIECEVSGEVLKNCYACHGTGVVTNPFIESEAVDLCRQLYAQQLERDYRNALHIFGAA